MERAALRVGRLCALAYFFWLVGAFCAWNVNPGQWSTEWRFIVAGLYAMAAAVMVFCDVGPRR